MFAVQGNANPLNSTEYAALDARIGDLSDLTTSDKSSVVGAVNALSSNIWKLIWTNPNPENGMAATAINIDISSYRIIIVECAEYYNILTRRSSIFGFGIVGISTAAQIMGAYQDGTRLDSAYVGRWFDVTNTSQISFTTCYTPAGTNPLNLTPVRIYAI